MWVDTSVYGSIDTVVFLVGFALWAPAYAIVAARAFRLRWVEIPLLGACADIAWDFLAGFVFKEHLGTGVEWFFAAAFVTDVAVVWAILRVPQAIVSSRRRLDAWGAGAAIAVSGLLVWSFRHDGLDTVLGTRSAYIAAVMLSAGYLWQGLTIDRPHRLSMAVAWIKLIADLLVSAFVWRHDGTALARALVVVLSLCDIAYVAALITRRGPLRSVHSREGHA